MQAMFKPEPTELNSSHMYIGGGYRDYSNYEVKPTTREVSAICATLFLTCSIAPMRKKQLTEFFCEVKNRPLSKGYCDSTIAYHTNLGRLKKITIKGKQYFTITEKGRDYAKSRGIL